MKRILLLTLSLFPLVSLRASAQKPIPQTAVQGLPQTLTAQAVVNTAVSTSLAAVNAGITAQGAQVTANTSAIAANLAAQGTINAGVSTSLASQQTLVTATITGLAAANANVTTLTGNVATLTSGVSTMGTQLTTKSATVNATTYADAQAQCAALPAGVGALVKVAADESAGNAGTKPGGGNPTTYYLYFSSVGLVQQLVY